MSGLTTLPTRAPGSESATAIGGLKSNARPFTEDKRHLKIPADEYNRVLAYLIDVCEGQGLSDGSTPGSLWEAVLGGGGGTGLEAGIVAAPEFFNSAGVFSTATRVHVGSGAGYIRQLPPVSTTDYFSWLVVYTGSPAQSFTIGRNGGSINGMLADYVVEGAEAVNRIVRVEGGPGGVWRVATLANKPEVDAAIAAVAADLAALTTLVGQPDGSTPSSAWEVIWQLLRGEHPTTQTVSGFNILGANTSLVLASGSGYPLTLPAPASIPVPRTIRIVYTGSPSFTLNENGGTINGQTGVSIVNAAGSAARYAELTLMPSGAHTLSSPVGLAAPLSVAGNPGMTWGLPVDIATTSGTGHVLRELGGVLGFGTLAAGSLGPNSVTDANLRDSAALSVIGRSANSPGDPADIATSSGSAAVLREAGGVLAFGTVATAGIADNAITNPKFRDSAALSVIGRSANSSGDPGDIATTASSAAVLREASGVLGFGTVATAGIGDDQVTDTKLRNSAALSVIGRASNTVGDPADIVANGTTGPLRSTGTVLGFRKDNYAATTAPTAANDSTQGYEIGSVWIDTTADRAYLALDVSLGTAVWHESAIPTAGTVAFGASNITTTGFVTAAAFNAAAFDVTTASQSIDGSFGSYRVTHAAAGTTLTLSAANWPVGAIRRITKENTSSNTIVLTPPSGGTLNGGAADASVTLYGSAQSSATNRGDLEWYVQRTGTLTYRVSGGNVSLTGHASNAVLASLSGTVADLVPSGVLQGLGTDSSGTLGFFRPALFESAGVLTGFVLTINGGDNTKFDVSAGIAGFSDYTGNPVQPVRTVLNYAGSTGNSVPTISGPNLTSFVGIDGAGVLTVQATRFTNAQRRTIAEIGILVHSNLTNLNAINVELSPLRSGISQFHDYLQYRGPLSDGIVYEPNGANLNINRTGGTIFKIGSNFQVNPLDPHVTVISAGAALTFRYRSQNGEPVSVDVTAIDPNTYDVAGVLTAVPNNDFTLQRITVFQTGLTRIQYGQATYSDMAEALANLQNEVFVTEDNIAQNGIFRGWLAVQEGTTDLSNPAQARFITASTTGAPVSAGLAPTTTDFLPEGLVNLYYTDARAADSRRSIATISVAGPTALGTEYMNNVTYAGGTCAVTLPSSTTTWPVGVSRYIKKRNSTTNTITVAPPAGGTINGLGTDVVLTLPGSQQSSSTTQADMVWTLTRESSTAFSVTGGDVRYDTGNNVNVVGNLTAFRLFTTSDGAAGTPAVRVGSDADTGLYRDASKGLVSAVDGADRLRIRTDGLSEWVSTFTNARLLLLTNGSGTAGFAVGTASPEGVTTATPGFQFHDVTNGKLYLKVTGTGNTGWQEVQVAGAAISGTAFNGAAFDVTTASQTIDGAFDSYRVTHSAAGTTLTLSSTNWPIGATRRVTKENTSTNTVTFAPPSGGTINGAAVDATMVAPGSSFASATDRGDFEWVVQRVAANTWRITGGNVRYHSNGFVTMGGGASVSNLIATTNGSAATPTIQVGADADTGLYRDATKGLVGVTDGTDRVLLRTDGICEIRSPNASGTAVMRLANVSADAQFFVGTATPEGAATGSPGDVFSDATGGKLYLKVTGTGNTGWQEIQVAGAAISGTAFNGAAFDVTTASQTIDGAFDSYRVTHSAAGTTLTLSTTAWPIGARRRITKENTSTNTITIAPPSGGTINGAAVDATMLAPGSAQAGVTSRGDMEWIVQRVATNTWRLTGGAVRYGTDNGVVVSNYLSATQLVSTSNGTAANNSIQLANAATRGMSYDAAKGLMLCVDSVERVRLTSAGRMEVISGAASTNPVLILASNAGDYRTFVISGSPESVITGDPGDKCLDVTNGREYLKRTGTGNTGWLEVQVAGAPITGTAFNGDSFDVTTASQTIDGAYDTYRVTHAAAGTTLTLSNANWPIGATRRVFKQNTSTNTITFVPPSGGTINGAAADATMLAPGSQRGSSTNVGDMEWAVQRIASNTWRIGGGAVRFNVNGDAFIGGDLNADQVTAAQNGTAASNAIQVSAATRGLSYDATKGLMVCVDSVERILVRTDLTTAIQSGAVGTIPVLRVASTGGDYQEFVGSSTSPEGVVSASPGDRFTDAGSIGRFYLKRTGSSTNTGWGQLNPSGIDPAFVQTISSGTSASINATARLVLISTAAGAFNLTAAALDAGHEVIIVKTSTDANTITIVRTSTETINGVAANYLIPGSDTTVGYQSWTLTDTTASARVVDSEMVATASLVNGAVTEAKTGFTTTTIPTSSATLGSAAISRVTYAAGTCTLTLPASTTTWPVGTTKQIRKENASVNTIVLQPNAGGTINDGAADDPVSLPGSALPRLVTAGDMWWNVTRDATDTWSYVGGHARITSESAFAAGVRTATVVVGNSLEGDTLDVCDYLDAGDGIELIAAIDAAYNKDATVVVRRGTYTLAAAQPPIALDTPTRVVGEGRGLTTIIAPAGTSTDIPWRVFQLNAVRTEISDLTIRVPNRAGTIPALSEPAGTIELNASYAQVTRVEVLVPGALTAAEEPLAGIALPAPTGLIGIRVSDYRFDASAATVTGHGTNIIAMAGISSGTMNSSVATSPTLTSGPEPVFENVTVRGVSSEAGTPYYTVGMTSSLLSQFELRDSDISGCAPSLLIVTTNTSGTNTYTGPRLRNLHLQDANGLASSFTPSITVIAQQSAGTMRYNRLELDQVTVLGGTSGTYNPGFTYLGSSVTTTTGARVQGFRAFARSTGAHPIFSHDMGAGGSNGLFEGIDLEAASGVTVTSTLVVSGGLNNRVVSCGADEMTLGADTTKNIAGLNTLRVSLTDLGTSNSTTGNVIA